MFLIFKCKDFFTDRQQIEHEVVVEPPDIIDTPSLTHTT